MAVIVPMARALLLCETVIVEEQTKHVTLVNCFTTRLVKELPSPPQKFCVFAFLTNSVGFVPITLTLRRLDEVDTIYEVTQVFQFTDRLREVKVKFRFEQLRFPAAGVYDVSLLVQGEPIAQTRFLVQRNDGSAP